MKAVIRHFCLPLLAGLPLTTFAHEGIIAHSHTNIFSMGVLNALADNDYFPAVILFLAGSVVVTMLVRYWLRRLAESRND